MKRLTTSRKRKLFESFCFSQYQFALRLLHWCWFAVSILNAVVRFSSGVDKQLSTQMESLIDSLMIDCSNNDIDEYEKEWKRSNWESVTVVYECLPHRLPTRVIRISNWICPSQLFLWKFRFNHNKFKSSWQEFLNWYKVNIYHIIQPVLDYINSLSFLSFSFNADHNMVLFQWNL